MLRLTPEITSLIARGALFVVNHSGGKDSQAMYNLIAASVPLDQIMVIHAHLPEVEWEGVIEHIEDTIHPELPFIITQARKRDGGERTFFNMVEERGFWPSPTQRQCTSDLKRGPIEREIRRFLKQNPQYNGLVVNCVGLRAEESSRRAKATVFEYSERNSKAGREWYDWLPIHHMLLEGEYGVWDTIARFEQEPHWAYKAGMRRLSCCFCIMACQSDLKLAARLNPRLYRRYRDMEQTIDQTFIMPVKGQRRFLEEIIGFTPEEAEQMERPNLAEMCNQA